MTVCINRSPHRGNESATRPSAHQRKGVDQPTLPPEPAPLQTHALLLQAQNFREPYSAIWWVARTAPGAVGEQEQGLAESRQAPLMDPCACCSLIRLLLIAS